MPTFWTFILLCALITLGTWQMRRLHWKTEILNHIHRNTALEPVDMDRVINDMQPDKWDYRRMTMKGHFLYDLEMHLIPRTFNGQPGYHLITPFQLESGALVLVNRGWVRSNAPYETIKRPQETLRILGTIATFQKKGFFTPENNFEKREIFYVEAPNIAKNFNLVTLLPFYIIEDPSAPSVSESETMEAPSENQGDTGASDLKIFPKALGISLNIPNNHLAYALTWYSLAVVLLILYSIFVYQWNHRVKTLKEGAVKKKSPPRKPQEAPL